MERGRIPHTFVGFTGDANEEPPLFFEDDFDEPFEPIEHFEEHCEFTTNMKAPIREKYEYQKIAPFKRPFKSVANRNEIQNTKRFGNHEMRSTPHKTVDDSHQIRSRSAIYSRQMESEKRRNAQSVMGMRTSEMSYGTNPKQARDLQLEREVANFKTQSLHHTIPAYKREMMNTTSMKRVRNESPCNSFMEPRPAKMIPTIGSTGENAQEKDKYSSATRSGQSKCGARSNTIPKQLAKDDQHLPKSEQPEKRISSPDDESLNTLREKLEKSKTVSNHLEEALAKYEHRLVQTIQSSENLQKQIVDFDAEKHKCTTDFQQHFSTAGHILKLQNQFQEKVELLEGFLNNESKIKETVASSCSTSSWIKFQETFNFYRKSRDEMRTIQKSYYERHEKLNKSVKETLKDDNLLEPTLKKLERDVRENLILCRGKRTQLETMNEKTREDIRRLNAEADRVKAKTNVEHDHMKAKFLGFFKLVKLETDVARERKNLLKDQAEKQIAKQRDIIISLSNKNRDVVAEIKQLSAKNCDLERDTNALKLKREKVEEECLSINSESNKFLEKLDSFCGQANSKTRPLMLQVQLKIEKFRELKVEKRQHEAKKLHLIEKWEHCSRVEEYKHEIAKLQDQLKTNEQIKETTEEFISIAKRLRQEKELRINAAKKRAEALAKRRRELEEKLNASNDSLLQERKAQIDMLTILSSIKGEETLTCKAKRQKLSSVENEVLRKLFSIADLELEQEQISKEKKYLDETYRTQRKNLVEVMCVKERTENEIRMIKKFVRDKLYTTVQEINRNTTDILKRKNAEQLALNAVEEEFDKLKQKLEEYRKLKKFPEKKEKLEDDK